MENIDQAVKVVDVAADLGLAIEKAVSAPGNVLAKLAPFLSLAGDVAILGTVDYSALLAEVKGLDADASAALVAELGSRLKLSNAVVASDIIEGLGLAVQQEQLVAKFVAYGKKLKG